MAGFIGQWGPRQEQLHPRGFHGRWIKKFNVPSLLPRVLAKMDQIFHPRTFHSDGQAGQYLHNKANPTRFKNGTDYRRMMVDWDEANAHLQMSDIDPSTQRYIDMMEENKVTLEDDLILTQVFTPEALGFTPQQMAEEHGDFDGLLGAVVADKGYSATHIGTSPQMGPGKIQMAIAVPKGTQVVIPSRAHNDRAVFLDRDQNLLITRVDRNPTTGEFYMMAVVMPRQKNEPNVPNLEAPRGAGFTPEQREARIGQPVAPDDQAARAGQRPPMGAGGQVTPEDVARQAESPPVQTPPPQAAPQPAPAPTSPAGQGPAPRNEPIHRESVGGTGGAEGRAPEEIATAPPEPAAAPETPAPAAPAAPASPQEEHLGRARQRAEAKRGYRQMATAIPVADALQTVEELRHQKQDPKVIAQHIRGITTDPSMEEVPADRRQGLIDRLNGAADLFEQGKANQGAARLSSAAREMDLETGDKPGSTVDYDPATMDSVSDVADGQQVEVLRPPVTHVDPDTGKSTVVSKGRVRPVGGAPEGGAPEAVPTGIAETPAAPAAPAAPAKVPGSKYTPDQERRLIDRAAQWRGQERNDEERRIVSEADAILARRGQQAGPTPERAPRAGRAPMAKKAAAKAAPAPAKKTAAPAKKAAPKKAMDLLEEQQARKLELAKRQGAKEQAVREKAAERTRLAEEKKAAAAKAKEERAAAKAAAPAKAAKKAAPAKDLTPEQQAAAEVQARADEAGLPNTVAELRAAAKEQGIRGFSTMRKEQLQRALLGEEVSTGTTKLQVVSPEKMIGHLERVDTNSEAEKLLEKHTLKDLKALATALEIDVKGRKLTTKNKLKSAILEQVRGAPGTDFEPLSPDEAISIRDLHIPDGEAGAMLRRGLVEVDDTDPASLRDESERLESHATQLRQRGDRINADLYQDAADRMGMRAQQISGMEEAPKPVKRAPRKAAAPAKKVSRGVAKPGKLDISTLAREAGIPGDGGGLVPIRQADLNDGLSPAEVAAKIRADAKQLEDSPLPKPRDEFDGKQGKKDRAAAVAQIRDLADRVEAASPAAPVKAAKAAPAKKVAAPKATPLSTEEFLKRYNITSEHPDFRNPPSREEVDQQVATMRRAQLVEIAKELNIPGVSGKTMPELRGEITDATVGHRLDSIATRGFRDRRPDITDDEFKQIREETLRTTGKTPEQLQDEAAARVEVAQAQRKTGKSLIQLQELVNGEASHKAWLSRMSTEVRSGGLTQRQANEILDAHKQGNGNEAIDRIARDAGIRLEGTPGSVVPLDRTRHDAEGVPGDGPVLITSPAIVDSDGNVLERGHVVEASPEEAAKLRTAETRAAKAVAPGAVPGPRTQARMTNQQRADAFRDAWNEAGIPDEPGRSATRSMAEIRDRVYNGDWSPEEGIRRLEVDIDFNKQDLAEAEAALRDENLDPGERAELLENVKKFREDIDAEEKASKFMRRYFRKEPEVTAEEAKAALTPEQRTWLDGADPVELREAAREQGLGELKGDTIQEVFQDAVQKSLAKVREDRAAKKAAKKALPKVEPTVDPDNPERLDVRQIGTGIDFKAEDKKLLDGIQERLDAGESPAKIAESIDGSGAVSPRAQRKMISDITDLDNRIQDAKDQKLPASRIKALEAQRTRVRETMARMEAQAKRQEELGRRLRLMKNPTKAAPAKAHRVGPGGSSFPADMPAEERARRLARIEKRQAAAAPGASKELPPLANGTRRKSMANVEVGDLVRHASGAQGELAVPKRVTSVERDGRRMVITREDGSKLTGAPQTAVWLGEAGTPDVVVSPAFDRMVRQGGTLPGKPVTRLPAKKATAPNPNLDGLSDDELRKILDSDQFSEAQKVQIRSELTARDAQKEARGAQARLLATALDRLDSARTEAQVRDILKGLTMPELKVVAGKFPLDKVGRSRESIIKAVADFHANKANFEVLTRGGHRDTPIEVGRFSSKEKIPNNWGTNSGEVAFHDDGPVGQALESMGQDAKLEVDGDSLENVVGKLATRSVRGEISAEQLIEELKRIDSRLPAGKAKRQLAQAIAEIDSPKREPLPLPEGTPAPLVELMQMFSGMPLARQTPRQGKPSAMDELKSIAEELGQRSTARLIAAMQQRLHNNIHESYGAEGAFELDRAVRRAIDQLREMGRRPS